MLSNMKVTVIPTAIGELECISQRFDSFVEKIGIIHSYK